MKNKLLVIFCYTACLYIALQFLVLDVSQNGNFTAKTNDIVKRSCGNCDSRSRAERHLMSSANEHAKRTAAGDVSEQSVACDLEQKIRATSCEKNHCGNDVTSVSGSLKTCSTWNLLKNCTNFKQLHRYNDIPVTEEEYGFPLAFAISMDDNVDQVEQILRTIYRRHNVYCIHVDVKNGVNSLNAMKTLADCFENVHIVGDPEVMVHASFTHVSAELKCMKLLYETHVQWKYYINLSGQEFPLRTNLEMVRILNLFGEMNDIETYDYPLIYEWKYQHSYKITGRSLAEIGKKESLKYDMRLSMGNPGGLFSRDFVDFILHDDVARDIISWFNGTYAPAQIVWATLVTLPWAPGGYPVGVRHLVNTYVSRAYILYGDAPTCHGRYLRGKCLLSCGDIPWLMSTPEFFANKFDWDADKAASLCLEKWYRQKAYQPETVTIDWLHYNKLPHLKYHRTVPGEVFDKKKQMEVKQKWLKEHLKST